jgi:hypothetical protein
MSNQIIVSQLPLAHLECKFVFDGQKYDVDGFSMGFLQPSKYNGQPEHEVQGGQMSVILSQMPDNNLYLWAKKSTLLKSGVILFQTDMGQTVLEIEFSNAYCINLSCGINALTGSTTSLIISPESVKIYGISHTNYWGVNKY